MEGISQSKKKKKKEYKGGNITVLKRESSKNLG